MILRIDRQLYENIEKLRINVKSSILLFISDIFG